VGDVVEAVQRGAGGAGPLVERHAGERGVGGEAGGEHQDLERVVVEAGQRAADLLAVGDVESDLIDDVPGGAQLGHEGLGARARGDGDAVSGGGEAADDRGADAAAAAGDEGAAGHQTSWPRP
jgi:hypothetical protein